MYHSTDVCMSETLGDGARAVLEVNENLPLVSRISISEGLTFFRMITASIRVMPHFIIIGGQRCGTTSLFNYLVQHPCIIPAIKKEVHYFDLNYSKNKGWYLAHFPSLPYVMCRELRLGSRCLTFEASPYYLFHPAVPKRIANAIPKVKLIVLLRNPVDRAYSHYNHEVRLGEEKLSFEDAIEREINGLHCDFKRLINDKDYCSFGHQHYSYLSRGIYVDQLKRWKLYFPPKNMLIIKSEELFGNPHLTLSNIFQYLEIPDMPPYYYQKNNYVHYPDMKQTTRNRLIDYFRPHNLNLYELLSTKFDWQ